MSPLDLQQYTLRGASHLNTALEIFQAFPHKPGSRPQSGHFREDGETWFQCVQY